MPSSQPTEADVSLGEEGWLFVRRWLANPLKVGAVAPSSRSLAKLVARNTTCGPDQAIVELGAGTGSVTKGLLKAGFSPERLFVVEIDGAMTRFLQKQFREVKLVEGDAGRLTELIPPAWHGKIGTVISGIPMITLPIKVQQNIIDQAFRVLAPGGRLLQYTYSLFSPLPEAKLGVVGERCGITPLNIPPAWVWSFRRADADTPKA